jgi:hypothetical protein
MLDCCGWQKPQLSGTEKLRGREEVRPAGLDRAVLANRAATNRSARNKEAGWLVLSPGPRLRKGSCMRSPWLTKLCSSSFRFGLQIGGLALVLAACSGVAWATPPLPPSAPEIDPSSLRAALMLLGGGVLLVADRFRRSSR